MSLFNLEIPPKEKKISHHPWEKTIKGAYIDKINCVHNSIYNPPYPKKKVKTPEENRVQFTVIGNRVTKEFNYCVKITKGLHKYRWKNFDAPIIRGVTGVEWPTVWNDLKIEHGGLSYCLKSQVAVLINGKFLGGEKELQKLIESRYVYHLCLDYHKEAVTQFDNFIRSSGLYADLVPRTSENFLRLCKDLKGGYSGTPIHRIVKDGWIQCGGYGLKSTDLECENFLVPHDRRGVLCMANDGRHIDCSTQFFVLLQPAPWMAHKYVAFGQLIDGNETLKKIESVPTYYESPKEDITIYNTGILNMDCPGITINKRTKEYLYGHVEDLIVIGNLFYESLLERVFQEIEIRQARKRLLSLMEEEMGEEGEVGIEGEDSTGNIRAAKRFIRKKEEIEKQLETTQADSRRPTGTKSLGDKSQLGRETSKKSQLERRMTAASGGDNKYPEEMIFEYYEYEPEELPYQHVSLPQSVQEELKPIKPFLIPLTDVPYPGEVDSTYDLKKFLRGDYCLECDLELNAPKSKKKQKQISFPSEMFLFESSSTETVSSGSLDSDDEYAIKKYLKQHVDRVSFAGGVIRSIRSRGKAKLNIFEDATKSELLTDEDLRRIRVISADIRNRELEHKKVSISVPSSGGIHKQIKRRQTGFVRPEDLEKIHVIHKSESAFSGEYDDDDDGHARKVRIAPSAVKSQIAARLARRPTGFVRPEDNNHSDEDIQRPSVLQRLYDDVTMDDEEGPTLKDYKPISEMSTKKSMLLTSPTSRIKSEDSRDKHLRHSLLVENESFEQVLNLQHSKRLTRKISSDYVKTIDQIEHKADMSIRSIEYSKSRPAMSVSEYQMKNQKHQEDLKKGSKVQVKKKAARPTSMALGLRLPGDTPLYSYIDMSQSKMSQVPFQLSKLSKLLAPKSSKSMHKMNPAKSSKSMK